MPAATQAAMLTLEQISAIDDRKPIEVPVAAWGGSVKVRALTLQQINECNKKAANPARGGEINTEVRNGWYLVEGMLEPQIDLATAEKWLTERAAGPVADILATILTESGLTERAKDAAKSAAAEGPAQALPDSAG